MSIHRNIAAMYGFREADDLSMYLGVPLSGKSPRQNNFQFLVDKVRTKLSHWKCNQLSFAGRVTLAKSVIEALPTYTMMSSKVPKESLKNIQRLQRDFIWDHSSDSKNMHTIRWQDICKPKHFGGLGLKHLVRMNEACISKLSWKLECEWFKIEGEKPTFYSICENLGILSMEIVMVLLKPYYMCSMTVWWLREFG